jgi:hypothetical protein
MTRSVSGMVLFRNDAPRQSAMTGCMRALVLLGECATMRRRLVGPSHHAIFRVALMKHCKLLRVPGIVQRLHHIVECFFERFQP